MRILVRRRKTEPLSVHICRVLAVILILILLCGYAVFLILGVLHDTPVITTKVQTLKDGLPLPTLCVYGGYNFNISCTYTKFDINGTYYPDDGCNKFISFSANVADGTYNANFTPTLDLKILPFEDANEGIVRIDFLIIITDLSFNRTDSFNGMVVKMYDTDTLMKINSGIINIDEINKIDPNLITSTLGVFYHQQTFIRYSRNMKKIIKPSTLADFDIFPKTISVGYPSSRFFGIGTSDNNGTQIDSYTFGAFVIEADNHSLRIETEQR
ncbi:9270_t:CDS:2 [Paraglomus occultum]|uniref:9270_t:CDS:1 n=1 Tax=Paraglomus occultum TaxID=144539 RepID=A0A9N9B0L8_9GLOM|nr:9270_t:CDS:2 [Paraglomus occultum]